MHIVPAVADTGRATRLGSEQFVRAHTPCKAISTCTLVVCAAMKSILGLDEVYEAMLCCSD